MLAECPPELRSELERLLDDYAALRKALVNGPPPLAPGRRIGRYRLVREIGRGVGAVVWETQQDGLSRHVALKLLRPLASLSDDSVLRFQREAEAAARLDHPAIVTVLDIGCADGFHYLAQELVEGGRTLADWLDARAHLDELPADHFREVARLFATVASALAVAHAGGVLHRDIKPGNILLTPTGQPRVADFGLAKIEDDLALSRTGERLGTPFYMSPEQALGRRDEWDERSDVFSLGSTLYEALTLTRPFAGDTPEQVYRKIVHEAPAPPRSLRSRVPRDLETLCLKCLEKPARLRYPSMVALAADLERAARGRPIAARPPGALRRTVQAARRRPLVTLLGLSATALLARTGSVMASDAVRRQRARDAVDVAWSNGDLATLLEGLPVAGGPGALPEDAAGLARALRLGHAGGPLGAVAATLLQEGRPAARRLAAQYLERDGLAARPHLTRFLTHELEATPRGWESGSPLDLWSRIFLDRPDLDPDASRASAAVRERIVARLAAPEAGARILALAALTGSGTLAEIPRITEGLERLAPLSSADDGERQEEARLSLFAAGNILHRHLVRGELGRARVGTLDRLVDAALTLNGLEAGVVELLVIDARVRRQLGLDPGRPIPRHLEGSGSFQVRAARHEPSLRADLALGRLPPADGKSRRGFAFECGRLAGEFDEPGLVRTVELALLEMPFESGIGDDECLEVFHRARMRTREASLGYPERLLPDADTHLGASLDALLHVPIPLELEASAAEHPDEAAAWSFETPGGSRRGCATGARALASRLRDDELLPGRTHLRLALPGVSLVALEFRLRPRSAHAYHRFLVTLQAGMRTKFPYRGRAFVSVELDGVPVARRREVGPSARELSIDLPDLTAPEIAEHTLTLRLDAESTTTLRLLDARLQASRR